MRRTYGQFCPVARSLDVLGERWTLLIVRELLLGPQRYSDLRDRLPGMWSNLLAQRLRDLDAAGLVRRRELPRPAARLVYELTERGQALEPLVYELARWGLELLDEPGGDVVPRHSLPLGLKGLVLVDALPDGAFAVACALDEGAWTVRVAARAEGLRPLTRVTVGEGLDGDATVTLRGSILTLLAASRGDAAGGAGVELDGAPADVAVAERLFGLGALVG
ncbi:MAG TPA: helix-turn-helix domain-containing protein [Acidimicrobiia bacterium]|nr:helix-turn-helix domain-containing protein [Acidimicrobiia bacterium]